MRRNASLLLYFSFQAVASSVASGTTEDFIPGSNLSKFAATITLNEGGCCPFGDRQTMQAAPIKNM
jgi:hypothetical protein